MTKTKFTIFIILLVSSLGLFYTLSDFGLGPWYYSALLLFTFWSAFILGSIFISLPL